MLKGKEGIEEPIAVKNVNNLVPFEAKRCGVVATPPVKHGARIQVGGKGPHQKKLGECSISLSSHTLGAPPAYLA